MIPPNKIIPNSNTQANIRPVIYCFKIIKYKRLSTIDPTKPGSISIIRPNP